MEARRSVGLRLTHLGAAGWEITGGERVILLDPYLSRLRVTGQFGTYTTPSLPDDARRVFGPEDDLVDADRVTGSGPPPPDPTPARPESYRKTARSPQAGRLLSQFEGPRS